MTQISTTVGWRGIRVQFHDDIDRVKLVPVCMYNLQTIKHIKQVSVPWAEWNDRDFDYCNDLVEWKWAAEKLGLWDEECE